MVRNRIVRRMIAIPRLCPGKIYAKKINALYVGLYRIAFQSFPNVPSSSTMNSFVSNVPFEILNRPICENRA